MVFGPFAFDEASGELHKHGVRVRLEGQPLQILSALVRQPGQVVTRDEFQQQLWKGGTFVDFDHGLNAAMNRLRQVLGDSADQPRYIETLPGRGYRFVAAVQNTVTKPVLVMAPAPPAPEVEPAAPVQPAIVQKRRKIWPLWMAAAGVVAGLAGGYLAAHRPQASSGAQPVRFSIFPPNGFAMEAGSSRQTFALSPDGARLAFTAMDASGVFQTFIRDLDGIEPRPLPNSVGSYHVFWAPDGRSLFLTVRGSLRRSALDGDSYQVVCDTPPIMLTGALLGPNLLISGRETNFVVPASGGTPQATKELYPWPQVLPDGKHLLYSVFDSRSGHRRARVVRYGDPATVRDLVETDSRTEYAPSVLKPGTGYLVYVRAGNILAQPFDPRSLSLQGEPFAVVSRTYSFLPSGAADFSVSNNGMIAYRRYQARSQLAWVNRRGEVVSPIGPANVNLKQARLSPDGSKIAAPIFDVNRGVNDMWIIDAESGAARRALAGPGLVDSPVWSPDSSKLAFHRAYDTPPKLIVRGLGENDADEPLPPDYFQVVSDWSHDGRFIAYTNTGFAVNNELNGDVWLIDMARGRKVIHLIRTPFHEANPAFSPDGRWLAFTSDESGHPEMYVQAFEAGESPRLTGERHLVSRHGATALRWARDGKELFYLAGDGRIYGVPITLSPKLKIGEAAPLFSISLEARAAWHSLLGFDVSADGQRLLVPIVTSPEKSEIVVIQNWEAAFERNRGKIN
ncbi:MAG: winged helix-turn-helix domain-containing protein [Acidobacteriia bacterium]|nr:winged helix-turn-helix domain-containing protein [Terriglobia bacterium]